MLSEIGVLICDLIYNLFFLLSFPSWPLSYEQKVILQGKQTTRPYTLF